jgi:hypothetical protein
MRALLLVLLFGCTTTAALKKQGEACESSSECDKGLLCNLGASPPVCAGQGNTMDVDAGLDAFVHPPIDGKVKPDVPPPIDAAIDAPPD